MTNAIQQPSAEKQVQHKRNLPQSKLIEITRTFQASVEKVFRAWSDPQLAKQWWGPSQYTAPSMRIDFRPGGKYIFAMQGPDKKVIWSSGIYEEIIPMKKIVCSDFFSNENGDMVSAESLGIPGQWSENPYVTVEFESIAKDQTKMVLSHEGIPQVMYDDCIKGWSESFDKLQKLVEQNS